MLAAPPSQARDLDSIAERTAPCTACHGEQGRATPEGYFPRIAGKPAGYLFEQLLAFRDGRRQYAPMARLLEFLSDDYLAEMARHFASLEIPYPPPPPPAAPRETLARGEALVRRGDRAREVPACAACHGDALAGVAPAVPGLLGLPRDYLVGQLGAWRNGERHSRAPDCMAEVAKRLEPQEIGAVAAWLAAQPVPAAYKPAATPPVVPLPIECGSVGR